MADLRFAAWFLWMTPLLEALSSLRVAARRAVVALSLSPVEIASFAMRMTVFSSLLTALLRSCALRFVRLRLIYDLMFATWSSSFVLVRVPDVPSEGRGASRGESCGVGPTRKPTDNDTSNAFLAPMQRKRHPLDRSKPVDRRPGDRPISSSG